MDGYSGDPMARRFDRLMALTAYGLLFFSVFTFWLTALIGAAIAFSHRRDADRLVAGHFRFQLRIFWWSLGLAALAVVAFIVAGGFALGVGWQALQALLDTQGAPTRLYVGSDTAVSLGATLAGLALLGLSALWTLAASAWGALKLVSDRPMGQSRASRDLEAL
jgi:uncharacterized membrane protein